MPEAAHIRESLPHFLRERGEVEPISEIIFPQKRAAARHNRLHPYFTSCPSNVVRAYIERYTQPGDMVLDVFGGTGVTAVEALSLGRKAISIDINPLAGLITRAKIVPIDLSEAQSLFERMEKDLGTHLAESDGWSEDIVQSHLEGVWIPSIPIPDYVDQDKMGTVDKLFTPWQLYGHGRILQWITSNIPQPSMLQFFEVIFSASVMKANVMYWVPADRSESRGNARLFQHFKYSVPANPTYLNAWKTFKRRFKSALAAKEDAQEALKEADPRDVMILDGPAQDWLPVIRPESVDYVFTDPPYGANIAYLDLSAISMAWLHLRVLDSTRIKETIELGSIRKTREQYLADLKETVTQTARVLKPGSMLSILYSHKEPAIWTSLVQSTKEAGFSLVTVNVQPTNLPSITKIKNPATTLSGGLVVSFEKAPERARQQNRNLMTLPNVPTYLVEEAKAAVIKFLGATTDEIFYNAYSKLLTAGVLEAGDQKTLNSVFGDLEGMLRKELFLDDAGYWQLKPDSRIPRSIEIDEIIRYLVFLKLYVEGPCTLDTLTNFVYLTLAHEEWQSPTRNAILEAIQDVARREDGGWRLDDRLMVQLRLPLEPTNAYVRQWGDFLHTDYLQRLRQWQESLMFTAPAFDFGPTDSSNLDAVLYGPRKEGG